MQGAQAGNDARRDTLARQFGAGPAQTRDATATAGESTYHSRGPPVILQATEPTLVQQFWRQRHLDKCSVFLRSEEVTRQVIGLGGDMNHTRQERFSSPRRWPGR